MKVKQKKLASVLGISSSRISMAVGRGSVNKTVSGLIDIEDLQNHKWIILQLHKTAKKNKQPCEVPDDLKILFKATPITENGKSEPVKNQIIPENNNDNIGDDITLEDPDESDEQKRFQDSINRDTIEQSRLKTLTMTHKEADAKLDYQIKSASHIEINPFGKLIFDSVAACRVQILNSIPNTSQAAVNEIKNLLDYENIVRQIPDFDFKGVVSDPEIALKLGVMWTSELEKVFDRIDTDIKARIRQARKRFNLDE